MAAAVTALSPSLRGPFLRLRPSDVSSAWGAPSACGAVSWGGAWRVRVRGSPGWPPLRRLRPSGCVGVRSGRQDSNLVDRRPAGAAFDRQPDSPTCGELRIDADRAAGPSRSIPRGSRERGARPWTAMDYSGVFLPVKSPLKAAGVHQIGRFNVRNVEVVGSSPITSTPRIRVF